MLVTIAIALSRMMNPQGSLLVITVRVRAAHRKLPLVELLTPWS